MSKSKDPFNFDDIYKQAGVEDLFVKKSMSEMRKTPTPPPRAPPSSSPTGHKVQNSTVITEYGSPGHQRGVSALNTAGSRNSSTGSLNSLEDPFASLGLGNSKAQPMMAQRSPLKRHENTPPPTPPSTIPSHRGILTRSKSGETQAPPVSPPAAPAVTYDLDDIFGGQPLAPRAPSSRPAAPHDDDPFALFSGLEGAAPAVPQVHDQIQEDPAPPPPSVSVDLHLSQETPTSPPYPDRPPPTYEELVAQQSGSSNAPLQQGYSSPASMSPASTRAMGRIREGPTPSLHQASEVGNTARMENGHDHPGPPGGDYLAAYRESTNSGGLGLKSFLKKAEKATSSYAKKLLQAGHAALEKLDQTVTEKPRRTTSDVEEGPQQVDPYVALQTAIQISGMPSAKQESHLAKLQRPLRIEVMKILREQADLEHRVDEQHLGQGMRGASSDPPLGGVLVTNEFCVDDDSEGEAGIQRERPAYEDAGGSPPKLKQPSQGTSSRAQDDSIVHPDSVWGHSGEWDQQDHSDNPQATPVSSTAPVSEIPVVEDLLGVLPEEAAKGPPPPGPPLSDITEVEDFFSGGAKATPAPSIPSPTKVPIPPRPSHSTGHLGDLLSPSSSAPSSQKSAHKSSSMIDLGALGAQVDVGNFQDLYADDSNIGEGEEPEVRRQLRAQRIAEKHAKMKAALAEKQQKEQEEAARREAQQQHKDAYKEKITAWRNKFKGNIRGLLGSLHTVMWENSGWQVVGMADLLEPGQVKKVYMKANLMVHPDKVRQKNGTDEQVAIADLIFDTLKEAWGLFQP